MGSLRPIFMRKKSQMIFNDREAGVKGRKQSGRERDYIWKLYVWKLYVEALTY